MGVCITDTVHIFLLMMQTVVVFLPSALNDITYNRMNGKPIATHFHNGHTKDTNKNIGTRGHECYILYCPALYNIDK